MVTEGKKPCQLFWRADTGAYAAEVVLELCGATWQRIVVPSAQERAANGEVGATGDLIAEFVRLNPLNQVPVLVLEDGTALTESVAIILHLSDCYPDSNLMPGVGSTERAQVYRWLMYLSTNIYDACLRHYYSDRYASDPTMHAEVKRTARQHLDHFWDLAESQLDDAPGVVSTGLTLADIYLHMLQSWHPDRSALRARCPKIARISASVHAHPTIARIDAKHTLFVD